MANKNVKKFEHKVYSRKLLRSILRNQLKTNKIKGVWHKLRGEGVA